MPYQLSPTSISVYMYIIAISEGVSKISNFMQVASALSGRRGPYGVAEYNFMLNKGMLNELQEALTQFTGAKFSGVAPGSGSGENPPPVCYVIFVVSNNCTLDCYCTSSK